MKLLLDTHALLWYYLGDQRFSMAMRTDILDPSNTTYVSPVNYWEMAIKMSTGKYTLRESFDDFIQHAIVDNGFAILLIEPKHASTLISLPFHHRDPFDRMLIAQAIVEGIPVVSADSAFDRYTITRRW